MYTRTSIVIFKGILYICHLLCGEFIELVRQIKAVSLRMESSVAESKENEISQRPNRAEPSRDPGMSFKTGQRFPTPSPGSGDRVFYETLLGQKPDSEMAQDWCVAYGVLEEHKAAKLYSLMLNRKGKKREINSPAVKKRTLEGPMKASAPTRSRKMRDDDDIIGDTG